MTVNEAEGRRYALDVLRSVAGIVEWESVAANLRAAAEQKPPEYREGILSVLAQVEART